MPKVTRSPLDEESPVANSVENNLQEILLKVVGTPIFFAGVNRKANTGNFENIDVYSAIAIPMGLVEGDFDIEVLRQVAMEAAELGFDIASGETLNRYDRIKAMQAGENQ